MAERDVERYLVSRVRLFGGLCWKFVSPGTAGVPDRIVVLNDKVYFVELKDKGRVLRELQNYRKMQLKERGQRVFCLDSKDRVDDFVSEVMGCDI